MNEWNGWNKMCPKAFERYTRPFYSCFLNPSSTIKPDLHTKFLPFPTFLSKPISRSYLPVRALQFVRRREFFARTKVWWTQFDGRLDTVSASEPVRTIVYPADFETCKFGARFNLIIGNARRYWNAIFCSVG